MNKLHPKAKRLGRAATHAEWLAMRDLGIGGSDAGAIMGTNPYKTARQVWGEKTKIEPSTFNGNDLTELGNVLEDHIRNLFAPDAIPEKELGTLQSTEHPHLLANCDGIEPGAIVEIKTSGARGWGKTPPSYYVAQAQHYMLVAGVAKTRLICAAVQGDRSTVLHCIQHAQARPELVVEHMCKVREYTVEADPEWQCEYLARTAEFWRRVQSKQWTEKQYAF